jgi:chromosome segregation ATPase
VIESILFFSLGFLCAGFLALMVAPSIWRRAVSMTRRRIEASVPLSLADIEADKDRMRAEFAMSTRRLEMSVKSLKDKAAAQLIEINRNHEELKRLAGERDVGSLSVSELETKAGALRAELRQREEQLQRLSGRLAETEKALEARALELERMGHAYDEASLSASNRQIELVVRETEVDKLAGDIEKLRGQRKEAERRVQELTADGKAARDALEAERKKAAELETKLERTLATLADREETLGRHEQELSRLREQINGDSADGRRLEDQLIESARERLKLEAQLADMTLQMTTLLSGAKGGDVERAMATLTEDRERLEARVSELTAENDKLKADVTARERAAAEGWGDERRGNALLRQRINDLAAEVVSLTATLEGPQSPIDKILAEAPKGEGNGPGQITSLADRVRALRKAASAS